jgi:hypothetical protein
VSCFQGFAASLDIDITFPDHRSKHTFNTAPGQVNAAGKLPIRQQCLRFRKTFQRTTAVVSRAKI